MIQLLVRLTVPDADAPAVVDALRSVQLTARLERGCARAEILREIDSPGAISYTEEWLWQKDLDARVTSSGFGRLLALVEALPAAPVIQFRHVADIRGLDYVATVRGEPQA